MRSIGIGAWGDDVTTLQEILNTLGYPVKIDGIFGTETRTAVLKFQETHSDENGAPLVVDGIAGPKTWWALTHATALPGTLVDTTPRAPTTSKIALLGIVATLIGGYILLTGK